jgi:threonine synthase
MSSRHVIGTQCLRCAREFGPNALLCKSCGRQGLLEVLYAYQDASESLDRASLERREPWMWRYRELLPVDELAELPTLQVGMTPIYGVPRLAEWVGLPGLWIKDEGRGPTGSIDDRAAALAVAHARERGKQVVAIASDLEGARSLACWSAASDLKAVVFLPAGELERGWAGLELFGPLAISVRGGMKDASHLCAEACERFGWLDLSSSASPLPIEGEKSAGMEIAEMLCERMPDWVVMSSRTGDSLAAVGKGLEQMKAVGIVKELPKLLGVTIEGAASLDPGHEPVGTGLAVRKTLRELQGILTETSVASAQEALAETARRTGLAPSIQAAAAIAGLRSAVAQGAIQAQQTALVMLESGYLLERKPSRPPPAAASSLEKVEAEARAAGLL